MDKAEIIEEFGMNGYGWADGPSKEEVRADLVGAKILFAAYEGASYEGDATVIFRRGGKIYEVYGSHCSCYGLGGQWCPEEGSVAELKQRPPLSTNSYSRETIAEFDAMRAKLRRSPRKI